MANLYLFMSVGAIGGLVRTCRWCLGWEVGVSGAAVNCVSCRVVMNYG